MALVASLAAINNLAFGYDVGVVSGSLRDMATSLNLSTIEQEAATSGLNFVAGAGALLMSGNLLDLLGRKIMLQKLRPINEHCATLYAQCRPLLLAAVSVASKENYDEAMKLSDVVRALPSLDLSSLRYSELAMLELIEWNATMWNRDEFVAYRDGLAALRGGNELGAVGFSARAGIENRGARPPRRARV